MIPIIGCFLVAKILPIYFLRVIWHCSHVWPANPTRHPRFWFDVAGRNEDSGCWTDHCPTTGTNSRSRSFRLSDSVLHNNGIPIFGLPISGSLITKKGFPAERLLIFFYLCVRVWTQPSSLYLIAFLFLPRKCMGHHIMRIISHTTKQLWPDQQADRLQKHTHKQFRAALLHPPHPYLAR